MFKSLFVGDIVCSATDDLFGVSCLGQDRGIERAARGALKIKILYHSRGALDKFIDDRRRFLQLGISKGTQIACAFHDSTSEANDPYFKTCGLTCQNEFLTWRLIHCATRILIVPDTSHADVLLGEAISSRACASLFKPFLTKILVSSLEMKCQLLGCWIALGIAGFSGSTTSAYGRRSLHIYNWVCLAALSTL